LAGSIPGIERRGRTDSFEVWLDTAIGNRGQAVADAVLSRCENDLEVICGLFGGVRPLPATIRVILTRMAPSAPAYHDRCDPSIIYCDVDTVGSGSTQRVLYTSYLLATQLVEVTADAQNGDWQGTSAHGEALSRVIAAALYPRWFSDFATSDVWLASSREDFVNFSSASDSDDAAIGCADRFLHYLHEQLDFSWRQIIAVGAPTLAVCFHRLTGRVEDPFPAFAQLHSNSATGVDL
jgi:hypothetical protein